MYVFTQNLYLIDDKLRHDCCLCCDCRIPSTNMEIVKSDLEKWNSKVTKEKYSIMQDVCVTKEYGNDGIHAYVLTTYTS
jgi:hypothetical protein